MPSAVPLLLSRLLLAALFVPAGLQTLTNIPGSTGYFAGLGLPMPALAAWGVGLFELIGGLAILLGLQTRFAAALFSVFCIVAGFLGHYGHGDGDIAIAFSTADPVDHDEKRGVVPLQALSETRIDALFQAAAEATQEAVLNSMLASPAFEGRGGDIFEVTRGYW